MRTIVLLFFVISSVFASGSQGGGSSSPIVVLPEGPSDAHPIVPVNRPSLPPPRREPSRAPQITQPIHNGQPGEDSTRNYSYEDQGATQDFYRSERGVQSVIDQIKQTHRNDRVVNLVDDFNVACQQKNFGALIRSWEDLDALGSTGNARKIKVALQKVLIDFIKAEIKELSPQIRKMQRGDEDPELITRYEEALKALEVFVVDPAVSELSLLSSEYQGAKRDNNSREVRRIRAEYNKKKREIGSLLSRSAIDINVANNLRNNDEADVALNLNEIAYKINTLKSSSVEQRPQARRRNMNLALRSLRRKWRAEHGQTNESRKYKDRVRYYKDKLERLPQELASLKQKAIRDCARGNTYRCNQARRNLPRWEKRFQEVRRDLIQKIQRNESIGQRIASWESRGEQYRRQLQNYNQDDGAYDIDRYMFGNQGNRNQQASQQFGGNNRTPYQTSFFNNQGQQQRNNNGINPAFGFSNQQQQPSFQFSQNQNGLYNYPQNQFNGVNGNLNQNLAQSGINNFQQNQFRNGYPLNQQTQFGVNQFGNNGFSQNQFGVNQFRNNGFPQTQFGTNQFGTGFSTPTYYQNNGFNSNLGGYYGQPYLGNYGGFSGLNPYQSPGYTGGGYRFY